MGCEKAFAPGRQASGTCSPLHNHSQTGLHLQPIKCTKDWGGAARREGSAQVGIDSMGKATAQQHTPARAHPACVPAKRGTRR